MKGNQHLFLMVTVPCPVPVRITESVTPSCWCKGISFPWNDCLPLQAHLSSFAMSLISFYSAFDSWLLMLPSTVKIFPCPSPSTHVAPALSGPIVPLPCWMVWDLTAPHGQELKWPWNQRDSLLLLPLLPSSSTCYHSLLLELNLHIIFIQQGLASTFAP